MKIKRIVCYSLLLLLLAGCDEETSDYPKPRGFLRLDFPERTYSIYEDSTCHFSFEIPDYFVVEDKENCNKDIQMPRFNATLFLTHQDPDTSLFMHLEYARKLVYDHSIKADEILEQQILLPAHKTYGVKYVIKGDAASPYQFYVTDSLDHFMRGALYFNVAPNYDSVRTSLDYIVEDLDKLLNTVKWH
jgi:gliding motility-associated lipoprotein GldD